MRGAVVAGGSDTQRGEADKHICSLLGRSTDEIPTLVALVSQVHEELAGVDMQHLLRASLVQEHRRWQLRLIEVKLPARAGDQIWIKSSVSFIHIDRDIYEKLSCSAVTCTSRTRSYFTLLELFKESVLRHL